MITLKTLSQATEQEVFDQVAKHLLTQGERSEGKDRCLYRGENGLKCAAGSLIGDDEYDPSMENGWWNLLVIAGQAPDTHQTLISQLQTIHDTFPPYDWKECLLNLATEFKIEFRENGYL